MPYTEVMSKFKRGTLHSGSKSGPEVKSRKQAVAIMMSEKRAAKSKPEYRSAMGRKVVHHSPDKHPEQTDPYSQMDKDLEKALRQGGPSNYQQMRERMKPMQKESPKPAQALMEYLKKMGGGYK